MVAYYGIGFLSLRQGRLRGHRRGTRSPLPRRVCRELAAFAHWRRLCLCPRRTSGRAYRCLSRR
jgi:hypothetical protein